MFVGIIFVGINFRGKTFKGFRGFNFRGIAAFCKHACMRYIFVGVNVRGTRLISENHEHLYPRKLPTIYGT